MSEESKPSTAKLAIWWLKFFGVAAGLYIVPTIIAAVLYYGLITIYYSGDAPSILPFWLIFVVSVADTGLRAIGAVVLAKKQAAKKALISWKRPKISQLGFTILVWGQYVLALIVATQIIDAVFKSFKADQVQDLGFSTSQSGFSLVLVFMLLVVIVPFCEEVIFRGYVYGKLKTKLKIIPSAIITSILFGIAHGQWNVGIDTALLSIATIYLIEKYNSIWPAVFLHSFKNGVAFVALFIV